MTVEELKLQALQLGFSSIGVASPSSPTHRGFYESWLQRGFHGDMDYLADHAVLKAHPNQLLLGVRSVIVVTLDYNQPVEKRPDQPQIARYALGRDYHRVIKGKLRKLMAALSKEHPEETHRACVDSAPIFEREFAQQAGLGWFGKNTCLIDSRRGSWFFIGVLLTSIEFPFDSPSIGGCGSCTRCIDNCPTGAIVFEDERWQVDSRRCISYLTIEKRGPFSPEEKASLHGWTFGCDICQEVCPFNEPRESQPLRGAFATEPDFLTKGHWPNLTHLATIPYEQWDVLTQGSPTRRTGREGLIRNARANLASDQVELPGDAEAVG